MDIYEFVEERYLVDLLEELLPLVTQILGFIFGGFSSLSLLLFDFFDLLAALQQPHLQVGHLFVQLLALGFLVRHSFHQLELEIFKHLQF